MTSPLSRSRRAAAVSALALAVATVPALGASAAPPGSPVQTCTVAGFTGSDPVGAAFSPDGSTVFVTNGGFDGDDTISVVDPETDTQVGLVSGFTGTRPTGIAFSPDGATAYVTGATSDSVSVIDVATSTQTGVVSGFTGDEPRFVALSPDGATAYVTSRNNNTISVIDTATRTQVGTVAGYTGQTPNGVIFTPDGTKAYVASTGSDPGQVSVIDTATSTQLGTVTGYVGDGPYQLALTPDGSTLYVGNAGDEGGVSVVDVATDTQTTSIQGFNSPNAVAIAPDGTTGIVTSIFTNYMAQIDTATNTVNDYVRAFTGLTVSSVAFSPDSSKAYLVSGGTNSVHVVRYPVITGITPDQGPESGGTVTTLTGSGFSCATAVTFDGIEGTSMTVVSDTEITVTTPAHASGPVDVMIQFASPAATTTASGAFTYVASNSAPVLSGLTPDRGPEAGGTTVTLTGTGFTDATAVSFDGIDGTELTVVDDTQIVVTTPAHAPGTVDVTVVHPQGDTTLAQGFTFEPAPAPTPTADPTVAPTSAPTTSAPVPSADGTHGSGSLPTTGANLGTGWLALGLIAVGGTAIFLRRLRRTTAA